MTKAHSSRYILVKDNTTDTITIEEIESGCLFDWSFEEWSHMIANPTIINPPEEEEEILVA